MTLIRRRTLKMDRRTQGDEIRKLSASPDIMLGSVQAITKAGQLLFASASGSQIGPLGSGAGKLILVIGSQKIVPDLESALRRIREHVVPYEDDAPARQQLGLGTKLTRILIIEQGLLARPDDDRPGQEPARGLASQGRPGFARAATLSLSPLNRGKEQL